MIASAVPSNADLLTKIALNSKAHWNYTKVQLDSWVDDLTITPEYLSKTSSFVYKADGEIAGFYILEILNMSTISLEFLFVLPAFIGKGIGHQLILHAIENARNTNSFYLQTLSDPNAVSFYAKYGFKKVSQEESSIPGRFLPVMEIEFPENR